jgi:DNA-binding MarR family transcriptional regulator
MTEPDLLTHANEIRSLAALLLKFFNDGAAARMQAAGQPLSALQYGVLQMLQFEPLTGSVISQRMGMDPSSIVRLIDSLERKGLAARGVDPHDRRRNPIQLTEKGRALLAAVPAISPDDPAVLAVQALGDERVRQLRDLLIKLVLRVPEGLAILAAAPRPPDYTADAEDEALARG